MEIHSHMRYKAIEHTNKSKLRRFKMKQSIALILFFTTVSAFAELRTIEIVEKELTSIGSASSLEKGLFEKSEDLAFYRAQRNLKKKCDNMNGIIDYNSRTKPQPFVDAHYDKNIGNVMYYVFNLKGICLIKAE